MADGEMGVEMTWALSRHGFLIAIAGVTLHDIACGRRGEKRDDGEGEGGRMEGSWMRREVRRGEDGGEKGRGQRGRRAKDGGEKRDDGEGEGGRMEGRWKMTEEVTECN